MKDFSFQMKWLFNIGCCQIVIVAFFRMVHTTKHKVLFYEMNHKIKMQIGVGETNPCNWK